MNAKQFLFSKYSLLMYKFTVLPINAVLYTVYNMTTMDPYIPLHWSWQFTLMGESVSRSYTPLEMTLWDMKLVLSGGVLCRVWRRFFYL